MKINDQYKEVLLTRSLISLLKNQYALTLNHFFIRTGIKYLLNFEIFQSFQSKNDKD